jgi:hypothetical protein
MVYKTAAEWVDCEVVYYPSIIQTYTHHATLAGHLL